MDAEIARNLSDKCLGGRPLPRSLEILWEHQDEAQEQFAIELLTDLTWFDDWVDPNDPDAPGVITFDRRARHFAATRVYDTEPGVIRVFRMYYSRLL